MKRILLCWIGNTDLKAAKGDLAAGLGPIGHAMTARAQEGKAFDLLYLLVDQKGATFSEARKVEIEGYTTWLNQKIPTPMELHYEDLLDPTDFEKLYPIARRSIEEIYRAHEEAALSLHLSPGTPSMAAVWVLLAKTRFPSVELISSSKEQGVKAVHLPFEVSQEFSTDVWWQSDQSLTQRGVGLPPEGAVFGDIVYKSSQMQQLVALAKRVAPRSVSVLIEGESGTGKELLARAIHQESKRKGKFVAVNCGAVSKGLFESEFFGHKKGAFTGANQDRKGYLVAANGGTLFLDEIGELPLDDQAKLLRALQEKAVTPVGENEPVRSDFRLITATNRNLQEEVLAGRFREDLFYRLMVVLLRLPPLRQRGAEDLKVVIKSLLKGINEALTKEEPGFQSKELSRGALDALLKADWPGNVRELQNTLQRAVIAEEGETINEAGMKKAILPRPSTQGDSILNRPLGDGFSLDDLLSKVEAHYLTRAEKDSQGRKKLAAELLGFENYQTYDNRLKRSNKSKKA